MGYRSDVAFAIHGRRNDVLTQLTTFRLNGGAHEKQALADCRYIATGKDGLVIQFQEQNTKWYSSYPIVAALESLFGLFADDDEQRFSCAFVRLGEEDDDCETIYRGDDPYELVRLSRSIDTLYHVDTGDSLERLVCANSTT